MNGKIYFGQTIKEPILRWKRHQSEARRGVGYRLYNAIRKYGDENFLFEVIDINAKSKDQLDALEQYYIREWKTQDPRFGYNHTAGGDGSHGFKHSDETKLRMSELKKGLFDGEKNPMFGKKHSAESRAKNSENNKGIQVGEKNAFYGKKHSAETRVKMSEAKKGKTWKIIDGKRVLLEKLEN